MGKQFEPPGGLKSPALVLCLMLEFNESFPLGMAFEKRDQVVPMKTRLSPWGVLQVILIGGPLLVCAQAQEATSPNGSAKAADRSVQAGPGSAAARAIAYPAGAPVARIAALMTNVSSRTAEILRMHGAGVDLRVIEAYVENSPAPFNPTAAEIISLHEKGIPDSLITAMIQRGAKLRQPGSEPAAPATAAAPSQVPAPPPAQTMAAAPYADYPVYPDIYPNVSYAAYGGYDYWYPTPFYFGFGYQTYPYFYRSYYHYRPYYHYAPYSHYRSYYHRPYYHYRPSYQYRPYSGYRPHYAPGRWSPSYPRYTLTAGFGAGRFAPRSSTFVHTGFRSGRMAPRR